MDNRKRVVASMCRAITIARQESSVTQADLAAKLGNSQSMLSRLEKGTRRLDLIELVLVSGALGRDPAEFVSGLIKSSEREIGKPFSSCFDKEGDDSESDDAT